MQIRTCPWSLDTILLKDGDSLSVQSETSLCLLYNPEGVEPHLGGRDISIFGFPFIEDGRIQQIAYLPYVSEDRDEPHECEEELSVGDISVRITQCDVTRRPLLRDVEKDESLSARFSWIDWQLHRYFELSDPHVDEGKINSEEAVGNRLMKRTWETIREKWLSKDEDEARMALIVRLAALDELRNALDKITQTPRRVLERHRTDTPIPRIRELDAACIRSYGRQAGRTTAEKAGAKQRLLALQRRENINTLENRVTFWVLNEIHQRAQSWYRVNKKFEDSEDRESSERVSRVRRLLHATHQFRNRATFDSVNSINPSGVEANYPLQFEPRYQHIWKACIRLQDEERIYTNAYTYQREFWSESGRLIFHSILTEYFPELRESTPFIRRYTKRGNWLMPFAAPGPFKTASGRVLLIDSLDLRNAHLDGAWLTIGGFIQGFDTIGKLGIEQILYFPATNRGVVVWYGLLGSEENDLKSQVANAQNALSQWALSVGQQGNWTGLIFASKIPTDAFDDECKEKIELEQSGGAEDGGVIGVMVPSNPQNDIESMETLKTAVVLALDAVGVTHHEVKNFV